VYEVIGWKLRWDDTAVSIAERNADARWFGNPPELLDPRYENVQNRSPLRPVLDRIIEARTCEYTTMGFFEEFQAARLAASPINTPSSFLADAQTQHRQFLAEVDHAHLGRHRFPGDPYKFSESPCRIARSAPLLNEHQGMIAEDFSRPSVWLGELGKSPGGGDTPPFAGVRVISFPRCGSGHSLSCRAWCRGFLSKRDPLRSPQRTQRLQSPSISKPTATKRGDQHEAPGSLPPRLIAVSDVVAENYSARVMASWGLDYPRVREVRADIIMASLQAFGQTGPRRDFVSFGPILMAFSGMTCLWRDPEVEKPGAACQTAFPDYIAPSYGALAILAALHYRARTGKGQYIDISQAETAASMIGPAYLEYLLNGREPEPQGNFSPFAAPHGSYPCKGDDRWCVISVETQEEWIRFCEVAGHREWAADPRFADLAARVANRKELDGLVESWTTQHTPHQVMMTLQRDRIAAGVVQTAEDLYRDPHLRERGFSRDVLRPQVGWVTSVGSSVRLTKSDFTPKDETHSAGEDNEAVFGELLGLSMAQIKELAEREALR
jgi:crotonobetainyl-CoA:carnitine CoA-transferase CaiB-like acyl-CoA transferase